MHSKELELRAVSYLNIDLMKTGYLHPYINSGDNEPSWDGYIYITNKKNSYTKEGIGRVPVQVKGKASECLSNKEISYSVNIQDLKNYLNDGGVLYFVVYVSENDYSIYYAQLEPVKILEILKITSELQKTKSIIFSKLPKMDLDIVNIFKSFLYNKQKQMSFIDTDIYTIDDLVKYNDKIKFNFTLSGLGLNEENLQKFVDLNNVYMYAQIPEFPILVPVSGNVKKIVMIEDTDLNVGVAGKVFYDKQIREKDNNVTRIKFGASFEFSINEKLERFNFNFKISNYARKAVKDIEFLIELYKHKGFEVNATFVDLSSVISNTNSFDFEKYHNWLNRVKKIVAVLDCLNIDGDLDCSKLTSTEWQDIDALIASLLEKKEVELKENIAPIITLKLQDYNIPIYLNKQQSGKYLIEDIFNVKDNLLHCSNDNSEKRFKVPIFRIMKPNQFLQCSTLNSNVLLSEYKRLDSEENDISSDAQNFMLILIKAADLSNFNSKKRKFFLELSLEFIEWLEEKASKNSEIDTTILMLNKLQIIKRQRELNDMEVDKLFEITESTYADDILKFGAFILLDEYKRAERIFSKFSEEKKEECKEYPIYSLLNKSEIDNS